MFILYDLIFLVFAITYLPYSLIKRKINAGIFQRLGFLRLKKPHTNPIWIHAVSVGEVMAIKTFVRDIKKGFPESSLIISTVTTTGMRLARKLFEAESEIIYLPFDLSCIVKRVIRRIHPRLFIAIETELWPNLLAYLKQANVPIVVANGRISDKSFRGYYRMRFLFRPILDKVGLFCVRSQEDRIRLIKLGVADSLVKITGNMKFDLDVAVHPQDIGLRADEKLFVCGSTHPGEEKILLEAYTEAHRQFPDLRLLIAPRHIERCAELEGMMRGLGFDTVRISSLKGKEKILPDKNCVFLLDTIGDLISFFSIADIVFMGGSLVDNGGHNIIEPAFFAKPVIFGRHMSNFKDIAETFLKNKAAIQVKDKAGLTKALEDILSNDGLRQSLSRAAKAVVEQNHGAVARTIAEIKRQIFAMT